jgi:hypothetical protein
LTLEPLEGRWLPGFIAPTLIRVGTTPYSVAVADLTGNGIPDVVTANWIAGTVSILLGNGDGSFQSAKDYLAGAATLDGVAVADLNSDGIPDLATVNFNTGILSVLFGNGDGSFGPPIPYDTGQRNAGSIAVGDVTGDGIPDLLVPGPDTNTVRLLLGNGDGTFKPPIAVPAGRAPTDVALADINGDGIPDVVTPNYSDNTASVLFGNGDGTFQAPVAYPTGAGPTRLIVGDFTGNGLLDLATTDRNDNTVSVLLGNGDGTFQAPVHYAVGVEPYFIAAGDLRGDGILDLVVPSGYDETLRMLLGNGDGTFAPAISYEATPTDVAVADLTGSGIPDLVLTESGANAVEVLHGRGDGTFDAPVTTDVGNNPRALAVGDFNGDGFPDLVTPNYYSNTVSIVLGNGGGTLQPATSFDAGYGPAGVAVGDFNGDGILDLAVADFANFATTGTVSILLGNGDGSFQAPVSYPSGGAVPDAIAVGHFDDDDDLDLAVVNAGLDNTKNGSVSILLGNGDGTFRAPQTYTVGIGPDAVVVGDFAGDGHDDVAVANEGTLDTGRGSSVGVLLGHGDGAFDPAQSYAVGSQPISLAAGDFTGSGRVDLVTANQNDDTLSVLLAQADGTFQAAVNFTTEPKAAPMSVVVADFDRDGTLDLAVSDYGGRLFMLRGNGDGTFRTVAVYGGVGGYMVPADLTGNGWTDLAIASVPDFELPFAHQVWSVLNDGQWPTTPAGGPGFDSPGQPASPPDPVVGRFPLATSVPKDPLATETTANPAGMESPRADQAPPEAGGQEDTARSVPGVAVDRTSEETGHTALPVADSRRAWSRITQAPGSIPLDNRNASKAPFETAES